MKALVYQQNNFQATSTVYARCVPTSENESQSYDQHHITGHKDKQPSVNVVV